MQASSKFWVSNLISFSVDESCLDPSGEVIALKHTLESFADFLRDTGIGSLPLIAPESAAMPTEQQMMEDMSTSVQALFERRQRTQENAAGIASLLAPETRGRR